MSKLHAVYSLSGTEERFLGQAYLTKEDLQCIDQSFAGLLDGEFFITLTDGEVINVDIIDSVEEIAADEE